MSNENYKTMKLGDRLEDGPSRFVFADGMPITAYKFEDLSNRYLRQVNFTGHDLTAAAFVGSVMPGAKLASTILNEASFVGASLWACDLRGAEGSYTDFRAATLHGALFDDDTMFVRCDFRGAVMSKDLYMHLLAHADEWQSCLEGVTISEWTREEMRIDEDFFTVQDS
jgi:uncharacterized protein YjbI with pentapeptide repeats